MSSKYFWIAASISLVAAACHCGDPPTPNGTGGGNGTAGAGGEGGAGGAGGGTVTAADICADVARRQCDYMVRCKADRVANFDFRFGRGDNVQIDEGERDTCVRWLANDPGCVRGAAGWDAGRASIDSAKYYDCVNAAYPTGTCDRDFKGILEKCVGAPWTIGQTANGSLCTTDLECASGWCNAGGATACGTCQPYLSTTAGASCNRDEQCDPATTYCPGGNVRCATYITDGGSCGLSALGRGCPPGTVCTGVFGQSHFCRPGKQLGEACLVDQYECFRTGTVIENTVIPETMCVTQPNDAGICQSIQAARNGACGNGETVVFPGTPLPTLRRGPFCPDTQFCSEKLCVDRRVAGQPCQSDDNCMLGLDCASGFCTAYTAASSTCQDALSCKSMLDCRGTTCLAEYAVAGETCNNSVPCVGNESFCSGGTCVTRGGTDAGCSNNPPNQCISGTCTGGRCAASCWQ